MGANTAAYSASKAGLHALTSCDGQGAAAATASASTRICPGIIDTCRMDDVGRAEAWDGWSPHRSRSAGPDRARTSRRVAVYLCTDQGSWVTGQQWNVDGGQLTIH